MKTYNISIQIRVELEKESDLSGVLGQLMYVPGISSGTALLTGLTMYKMEPTLGTPVGAGTVESIGP